jgi:hypothetical protein
MFIYSLKLQKEISHLQPQKKGGHLHSMFLPVNLRVTITQLLLFFPFSYDDQIMGGRIVQAKVIPGSKDGDNAACLPIVSSKWVLFS